jgi:hypothetical protein
LSKFSKAGEFHFPFHRQVADFPTEAYSPPNRRTVVDDELSESVQLEVVPVLRQMLNERVLQTRDEDVR